MRRCRFCSNALWLAEMEGRADADARADLDRFSEPIRAFFAAAFDGGRLALAAGIRGERSYLAYVERELTIPAKDPSLSRTLCAGRHGRSREPL